MLMAGFYSTLVVYEFGWQVTSCILRPFHLLPFYVVEKLEFANCFDLGDLLLLA